MSTASELQRGGGRLSQGRFAEIAGIVRYPLAVYLISRVLYLAIAVLDIFLRNWPLNQTLRQWDGRWYVLLAHTGYPHTLPTHYNDWSTLGFEPLYSMMMWLGSVILPRGAEMSGVLISLVCGAVAVVEMSILAQRWWGRAAARRSILFFCLFPGTIVFSMVYAEGLTLMLVAGALLCLEDRRWVLGGLLGGLATAIEPVAFAFIPAALAVSLREIWRAGGLHDGAALRRMARGLGDRGARRSLWAPILSPFGAAGFAIFLWSWVGSPLANYKAQKIAWGENSSILAVYIQFRAFVNEFRHWHGWSHINLNLPAGFLGALFMVWALWQMWKARRGVATVALNAQGAATRMLGSGISLGAWVWTGSVAVLTLTSDQTPPNPRMLVCAFPLLLAVGARHTGRNQKILLGVTLVLLVAMSIGTFASDTLRP